MTVQKLVIRFSTGQTQNASISVEVHNCVISLGSAALQGELACTKYVVSLLELHSSETWWCTLGKALEEELKRWLDRGKSFSSFVTHIKNKCLNKCPLIVISCQSQHIN